MWSSKENLGELEGGSVLSRRRNTDADRGQRGRMTYDAYGCSYNYVGDNPVSKDRPGRAIYPCTFGAYFLFSYFRTRPGGAEIPEIPEEYRFMKCTVSLVDACSWAWPSLCWRYWVLHTSGSLSAALA